ncbi:tRNA-guanine transglycosylase family protein [Aspergillus steynii IBT 23096]|uniref:Queuine tRNA-ribosyltransferase accessory subunit 2 n=1 Tax=Aspergillus steynii IBT 23096 TaxID=1392250 RepID=A0A2I2GGD7_9EURO|nr:tRNA-guanine transglycosylase family protein [Aspergillus steynii IBT 23096]PLB51897.1 tRNA-guanine transglycosylase family protein [Aspergillus steynii IBT 23096]
MDPEAPSQSRDEMLSFSLLNPTSASTLTPRLGNLAIAGRNPISTPHYIPLTSRGAVPHVAHDVMLKQTAIGSLYFGLEDFIEKQNQKNKSLPIYQVPTESHESALRKFTCFPEDLLLVLGPRRVPPIPTPPMNTDNSIAIMTAFGFRQLDANQYVEAVQNLRPDIVVGLADLVVGQRPGYKRRGKMVDRTHAFAMHATENLYGQAVSEENRSKTAYFAPVLPLDNAEQMIYLDELESDLRPHISGLALYEPESLSVLPETLGSLPRLLFGQPATPQDVLREVSLGADLLTVPFVGVTSDAGVALEFAFPPPCPTEGSASEARPLGFDLWSSVHTFDTSPLVEGCQCYTCRNHHRAYIHHLLTAKEMLAWTLLQIHNHHTMDVFFQRIRESIQRGTFEAEVQAFQRFYASELPKQTGQGPRLRGHQITPSKAHQPRRNPRGFGRLDDALEKFAESQSSVATPDTDAEGLEAHGFAKKQDS